VDEDEQYRFARDKRIAAAIAADRIPFELIETERR
jgi:hypothetical protein